MISIKILLYNVRTRTYVSQDHVCENKDCNNKNCINDYAACFPVYCRLWWKKLMITERNDNEWFCACTAHTYARNAHALTTHSLTTRMSRILVDFFKISETSLRLPTNQSIPTTSLNRFLACHKNRKLRSLIDISSLHHNIYTNQDS